MQTPCNPSYGWSLVFAMTIAINSIAHAQAPTVGVVFISHEAANASRKLLDAPHGVPTAKNIAAENAGPAELRTTTPHSGTSDTGSKDAGLLGTGKLISVKLNSEDSVMPPVEVEVVERVLVAASDAKRSPTIESRGTIDSRSVACRAGFEWLPAKQLRQHARSVQQLYREEKDDCTRQAANAVAKFFELQADHQQDLAAAIALRGYYARAAIVEQFVLLNESEGELQKQRERQSALQSRGLAAAIDLTSLDREGITLKLQRIQLQQRDRQLRQSLNDATRTNYDWEANDIEPLEVREQMLDTVYLERFALGHRRDLLALQCLSSQINSGTAPMLSSIVNSATGMASLPLPKRCLLDRMLGREDNSVLTNNLKESIAIGCETQASAIRREVSEKSITLELAYQRIRLAQEATATWSKRLQQLERLAELGDSRADEIIQAKSSLLTAKALEIERRLEAKLAEIALAEACGCLYARCCHGLAWLVTAVPQ